MPVRLDADIVRGRRSTKIFAALMLVAFPVLVGCVLCEGALHIMPSYRHAPSEMMADAIARSAQAVWRNAEITASDGSRLSAWLMEPKASNGGAVILLHGIGDTRSGSTSHAEYLLQSGYTVLLPDSRDHGISGGGVVTYGVQERDDVHRWADWLFATGHPRRLYGLGESLGGSILLQALTVEPRFRAVIAECPYSTFRKIAYERVGRSFGLRTGVAPWLLWPLIEPAFLYARLRYGVDLNDASPERAMSYTKVPILLVHGSADNATDPENSRSLRALNPDHVRLWEVPGAGHVGAFGARPEEFRQHVLAWFDSHSAL